MNARYRRRVKSLFGERACAIGLPAFGAQNPRGKDSGCLGYVLRCGNTSVSCSALHVLIPPDAVVEDKLAVSGSGRYISETRTEWRGVLQDILTADVGKIMTQ